MKKYIFFILAGFYVLAGCSTTTKVSISKYQEVAVPDTINYTTYWTAMRCCLPELRSRYQVPGEKIDFSDGLIDIKKGKIKEAEIIFKKLIKESENDTIVSNSRLILSSLLKYQSKWQEYLTYFKTNSETDSAAKVRLLFPAFMGSKAISKFANEADTISIKIKKGLIFVPVSINGKEYEFLFDTGAENTTLSSEIAKDAGVYILDTHPSGLISSTGQVTSINSALINELNFANFTSYNHPCFISDISNLKYKFLFFTILSLDGLIGWDIIKNLDIEIDYYNEKMIIRRPVEKNVKDKNLFWLNRPIVNIKGHNGVDLFFTIDLGAQYSSFYDFLLVKVKTDEIQNNQEETWGIGGKVNADVKIIPKISFVLDNYELKYTDLKSSIEANDEFLKLDGVLGNDFPMNNILKIDASNGIIELILK